MRLRGEGRSRQTADGGCAASGEGAAGVERVFGGRRRSGGGEHGAAKKRREREREAREMKRFRPISGYTPSITNNLPVWVMCIRQ